jgi:endonuclease YncB( thermonuclease family)
MTEARVVEVVDGDTIKVEIDGVVYSVRYIGINSPETNHPSKGQERLGPEATAANAQLVAGKTVFLEKDVSETDRYGRLLRYVYVGDVFVNRELVRLGFAQVSTFPPDVKYEDVFGDAQHAARQAGRGLWAGPTETPTASALRIDRVDKRREFVDIFNGGPQALDLAGWVLVSEKGDQRCTLGGVIQPGARLRIFALDGANTPTEYYCKFREHIWNNSEPDPAVLLDPSGSEVDRE